MTLAPSGGTVAVIVPMYNAAETIAETLRSICRQTYRDLDIVVVDDGSTDQGAQLVESFAENDRRIRLVRQTNAGVATARNHGAEKTTAPYLAFIDADDLWAPEKTAEQMKLAQGGAPALIYCWFCLIDGRDRAFRADYMPISYEGDVRRQLARENFIGNGSSMLLPREVFDRCGGFDTSLRANNAQGCEDYMFAMAAAQQFPFRVVPRRLVGYRVTPENMSSDAGQMVKSYEMVVERFIGTLPQFATEFEDHRRDFLMWNARRAASDGSRLRAIDLVQRLKVDHEIKEWPLWLELAWLYLKGRLTPQWAKTIAIRSGLIVRPKYQDVSW